MSAWTIHAARATLFPALASGAAPRSAFDVFKSIWGEEPAGFQTQPPSGSPFPNSLAQGAAGPISRLCQVQPVRVDLTFTPSGMIDANTVASIGDTELVSAEMNRVIDAVDEAFKETPLNRAALFLQMGQEAPDFPRANEVLSAAMWENKKAVLGDEEDFILQLNRPRLDGADASLKLNYITRWSVERLNLMTFLGAAPIFVEKIMPTIVLDNSNMPLQKPFAVGQAKKVLSELFKEMPSQLKQCNISFKGF